MQINVSESGEGVRTKSNHDGKTCNVARSMNADFDNFVRLLSTTMTS